jgi:hypothetical protein
MHARVAAFENPDMSRTDELIGLVRDRQSQGKELPDALGMYLLIDRAAGKSLGISIFESEDAIRAAEPAFERMGDEVPEELRGKRVSVDTYEVAIHEVSGEPAAARLSILSGDPAKLDDGIRAAVDDVLPEIREVDGWKGIIMLVDRTTGASKAITLWESQAAMSASEGQATAMRQRTADAAGETITAVERYDVATSFDRAPKLVGV